MAPLRKYLFLAFLLIGALACSLTTPPALPTAIPQPFPTNASTEAPLEEQVRAGACGLKLHEDWGTTPAAINPSRWLRP